WGRGPRRFVGGRSPQVPVRAGGRRQRVRLAGGAAGAGCLLTDIRRRAVCRMHAQLRPLVHGLWACAAALLLSACSTARPWSNAPLAAEAQWPVPIMQPLSEPSTPATSHPIIAAVTLS